MKFSEFLAVVSSRWRIVLASVLLVLAATVVTTLRVTPTYVATTRVFFTAESTNSALTSKDLGTYVQLLSSPVVMDPLRQQLNLPPGTTLSVSATVIGDSPMMDITAQSSSARVAAGAAMAAGPQLASTDKDFAPLLASGGQGVKAITIAPAAVPSRPVSPNLMKSATLGLLAGLALGMGLALLRNFLDTRVRGEEDLRAVSDLPVLGRVPLIPKGPTKSIVFDSEPQGVAAEEYRRLRTNLQFADITAGGKHSFAISSATPGEGKTTTAVNLALALADSGTRVLLVDADLRDPSVATVMGLEGHVGLTTVLLGRATIAEAAQPWGDSSLAVLPSGAIPPNPSELLGSAAMKELFGQLLAEYDYVLVDSPPVLPVVDPVLIDRLVGGLLLVIGVNTTPRRDLTQAVRQLMTVGAKLAGFVLNRMPNDDATSHYVTHYTHSHKRKDKRLRSAAMSQPGILEDAVPVTSAIIPGPAPDQDESKKDTSAAERSEAGPTPTQPAPHGDQIDSMKSRQPVTTRLSGGRRFAR